VSAYLRRFDRVRLKFNAELLAERRIAGIVGGEES